MPGIVGAALAGRGMPRIRRALRSGGDHTVSSHDTDISAPPGASSGISGTRARWMSPTATLSTECATMGRQERYARVTIRVATVLARIALGCVRLVDVRTKGAWVPLGGTIAPGDVDLRYPAATEAVFRGGAAPAHFHRSRTRHRPSAAAHSSSTTPASSGLSRTEDITTPLCPGSFDASPRPTRFLSVHHYPNRGHHLGHCYVLAPPT